LGGKPLPANDLRFREANQILTDWQYWDEADQQLTIEPHIFLQWCVDEKLNSEWLRLPIERLGFS
jgi:hypothetical protein